MSALDEMNVTDQLMLFQTHSTGTFGPGIEKAGILFDVKKQISTENVVDLNAEISAKASTGIRSIGTHSRQCNDDNDNNLPMTSWLSCNNQTRNSSQLSVIPRLAFNIQVPVILCCPISLST
jgi:hypothetical protein